MNRRQYLSLLLASAARSQASDSLKSVEIGAYRQLLLDDWIVESRHGVSRVVHQPEKLARPVLIGDQPWEGWAVYPHGSPCIHWDPSEKLIYIPAGRDSSVTIVHEDSPDKYTVVEKVTTAAGAKTISVDPVKHVAYLFQPVYGPPPANAPKGPGGRTPRGPVVDAFLYVITH